MTFNEQKAFNDAIDKVLTLIKGRPWVYSDLHPMVWEIRNLKKEDNGMIFSKQRQDTALAYTSAYYDKILEINVGINAFYPIKVNGDEWVAVPKFRHFTDWVNWFTKSTMYKPCEDTNPDVLEDLGDIENIKCRLKFGGVFLTNYYKMVNKSWHLMQLELYPAEDDMAYLFVRDLTRLQKGVKNVSYYD